MSEDVPTTADQVGCPYQGLSPRRLPVSPTRTWSRFPHQVVVRGWLGHLHREVIWKIVDQLRVGRSGDVENQEMDPRLGSWSRTVSQSVLAFFRRRFTDPPSPTRGIFHLPQDLIMSSSLTPFSRYPPFSIPLRHLHRCSSGLLAKVGRFRGRPLHQGQWNRHTLWSSSRFSRFFGDQDSTFIEKDLPFLSTGRPRTPLVWIDRTSSPAFRLQGLHKSHMGSRTSWTRLSPSTRRLYAIGKLTRFTSPGPPPLPSLFCPRSYPHRQQSTNRVFGFFGRRSLSIAPRIGCI